MSNEGTERVRQGVVAEAKGSWADAAEAYERALEDARKAKDREAEATACYHLARLHLTRGREDARACGRALRALVRLRREGANGSAVRPTSARPLDADDVEVVACRLLARTESAKAERRLVKLLDRHARRRAPATGAVGEAMWQLALLRLRPRAVADAMSLLEDAAAAVEADGDATTQVRMFAEFGRALVERGIYREAVPFLRAAHADAERLGDAFLTEAAGVWLARALVPLQAFTEARALIEPRPEPVDVEMHRELTLARCVLDFEEGLERLRLAELRRLDEPRDLEAALALLWSAEGLASRLLSVESNPRRKAAAQLVVASTHGVTALRTKAASERARASAAVDAAATACDGAGLSHLALRARALSAQLARAAGAGDAARWVGGVRPHVTQAFEQIVHAAEVLTARRVQDSLLAAGRELGAPPEGTRVAGELRTATTTFGDLWLASGRGRRLDVVVADAAGHGVDSVGMMVLLASVLPVRLGTDVRDVAADLGYLDDCARAAADAGSFTCLAWLTIDLDARRAEVHRLGDAHAWYRAGRHWKRIDTGDAPLGMGSRGRPRKPTTIPLDGPVEFLLCTDGIVTQHDRRSRELGTTRLRRALDRLPRDADPAATVAAVHALVDAHRGAVAPDDDRTVVAVGVRALHRSSR